VLTGDSCKPELACTVPSRVSRVSTAAEDARAQITHHTRNKIEETHRQVGSGMQTWGERGRPRCGEDTPRSVQRPSSFEKLSFCAFHQDEGPGRVCSINPFRSPVCSISGAGKLGVWPKLPSRCRRTRSRNDKVMIVEGCANIFPCPRCSLHVAVL